MAGLWPAGWAPVLPEVRPSAGGQAGALILTAALPPAVQATADAERCRLYPEGAARAPAHLGLFRHLPGSMADELGRAIRALASQMHPPTFTIGTAQQKNGALMLPVQCPALERLRSALADQWHGLLSPGDLAPPRLHITLAGHRAPKTAVPDINPSMPTGPWRCPGLLLWRVGGYGEACWTPLVAWRFHR